MIATIRNAARVPALPSELLLQISILLGLFSAETRANSLLLLMSADHGCWSRDASSLVALSECTAVGRKP
jgi:hypothetical protein